MALVAYDGFDHYTIGADSSAADVLNRRGGGLQWTACSAAFASPGRVGTGSIIALNGSSSVNLLSGTLTAPLNAGYVGFAIQIPAVTSARADPSFALMDMHTAGGIAQLSMTFNQARSGIDIYRDGTLIAATANNVITYPSWNYVEFYALIDPAQGVLIIRSNGQTILTLPSLDTRSASSANSFFDGFQYLAARSGAGSNTQLLIDDVYVADTSVGAGPFAFNSFAGDVRVVTLYPTGNIAVQWTPLSGENWQEVSALHNTGDSAYNASATENAADLFSFQALSGTISSILAVQLIGSYRKDDAGTREVTQNLVSSATLANGVVYSIPTNYVYIADFWTTDPHTTASWTASGVNSLAAGYTLTL